MSDSATVRFFTEALSRARACRTDGDTPGALRELRGGLDAPLDYADAVAAARFLENTTKESPPVGYPARRVALIGSDTLTFLRPVIRTLAFRDGWWPIFYEAPFGTWKQEILEPRSKLREFQPEVTLLLRGWHAAGLSKTDESPNASERIFEEELALARRAVEGLGVVLWPGYDLPADQRRTVLAEINKRLRAALPAGVLWVDLSEAQATLGDAWVDARWWEAARQHPSAAGSMILAEFWLALLRARWGLARKVLVTDLDNVLWGGIVGEDGVEGLRIGPGTKEGEAHLAYQQYLVELKNRGVLLAVCSKNNEADAAEVFSRRAMPLKREDFVGWAVNWTDKAANLRALAKTLQLGLDSFVFVDDQGAERRRVRQSLPEVAVPEMPADPAAYVAVLKGRRFFETLTISEEDRARTATYHANQQRVELQSGAASLEDFLRGLEMTIEQGPFSEATLDRVEQLLGRTNQWNLTTRRPSRAEIAAQAVQPGVLTQWFRLKDRFGDNGLVGLWIAVPRQADEWEIDSWVMSCRVIGRGLEDLMFNALVNAAKAAGAKRLHGIFRPTKKNGLVADLLPKLGFLPAKNCTTEGEQAFVLEIRQASPRQHYIRDGG